MAERRMFAKTIIDSDAFLDMPLSAQALYFHLSMRADDDGFINNPKKIQRMVGASDDDCKLLIMKRFIITFESGVIVIKHWKIHNYIRNDRKKETNYTEEMALLIEKDNGAYSLKSEIPLLESSAEEIGETPRQKAYKESTLPYSFEYKIKKAFWGRNCPVCGAKMQEEIEDGIKTSNRIPSIQHNIPISKGGKHELGNISVICKECNISLQDTKTGDLNAADVIEEWDKICMSDTCPSSDSQMSVKCQRRLGKDRLELGKDSIEEDREPAKKIPYQLIADMYNEICISLPSVKSLSDNRKKAIKARLNKYSVEQFKEVFTKAEASDFLKGSNGRNWAANFDWLIKDANFAKVLDGNYDNKAVKKGSKASYDMSDYESRTIDDWEAKPEPVTAADNPEIAARAEALRKQFTE